MHFSVLVALNSKSIDDLGDSYQVDQAVDDVLAKYSTDYAKTFHSRKEEAEYNYNEYIKNKTKFDFAVLPNGTVEPIIGVRFCTYDKDGEVAKQYMVENNIVYELRDRSVADPYRAFRQRQTRSSRKIKLVHATLSQMKISFDTYATEMEFLDKFEDDYGDWYNEDTQYDWYAIGGRWSNMLIAKNIISKYVDPITAQYFPNSVRPVVETFNGYHHLDVARKSDICFDKMKEEIRNVYKKVYTALEKSLKDGTKIDEVLYNCYAADNGNLYLYPNSSNRLIYSMNENSTFEEFLAKIHPYYSNKYPIFTNTFVSKDCNWESKDFGYSDEEWTEKITEFIDSVPDDDYLAIVDCHM